MHGGLISKGNPLVNDEGHAKIMNDINLNVNESTKLAIFDEDDIMYNSLSFSEAMTFLIGIRGSDFGIRVLDMFSLIVGMDNMVFSHFSGALDGATLHNVTKQFQIIEQNLSHDKKEEQKKR